MKPSKPTVHTHSFRECEKLVGRTKKPEPVPHTSSTHAPNRAADFRNQFKCKIQSGALDSPEGIGLLHADKQHGLMVRDPAWTIFSKYTVGSSVSKIQYVSTWKAMSPNDLYAVGLVWLWIKSSLWETNGMRGRDWERRTYLLLWKVRPAYRDLLANLRSWRLREFSDWRWRNHVGYPIAPKSSYEDNLPLVPLMKQDLGNTGCYFGYLILYTTDYLCATAWLQILF